MTFQLPSDDLERQIVARLVEAAVRVCASAEGGRLRISDADVRDLRRSVEDARYMGLLRG